MLGVRLDKETEQKLDRLARETHRTKSYYVKEAIAEYLAEKEDVLIAMARLEKREKPLTTGEMWKALGWDGPQKKANPTDRKTPAKAPGTSRAR